MLIRQPNSSYCSKMLVGEAPDRPNRYLGVLSQAIWYLVVRSPQLRRISMSVILSSGPPERPNHKRAVASKESSRMNTPGQLMLSSGRRIAVHALTMGSGSRTGLFCLLAPDASDFDPDSTTTMKRAVTLLASDRPRYGAPPVVLGSGPRSLRPQTTLQKYCASARSDRSEWRVRGRAGRSCPDRASSGPRRSRRDPRDVGAPWHRPVSGSRASSEL